MSDLKPWKQERMLPNWSACRGGQRKVLLSTPVGIPGMMSGSFYSLLYLQKVSIDLVKEEPSEE